MQSPGSMGNPGMKATAVAASGVNKWYGGLHVLRGVDLTVAEGEVVVICGPSGSGKSTFLRCINRLEGFQSGKLHVNGSDVTGRRLKINDFRRRIGFVFQQFHL